MSKKHLMALTLLAASLLAQAGPGHDHGDAPPAASGNGPQRLPDGAVFLPKPAQRQIGVRTQVSSVEALPRVSALAGSVVMDPNAGGKVQALMAGRLEAGPRGLPSLGQTVRKGEVLAYVRPGGEALERAGQAAQIAEWQAQRGLAEQRLTRLKQLADSVPRKEIEAAESELASLRARIVAVGDGLASREALLAPVNGVIASAAAVAGQVVEARELLFEIVDPARLRVEALAYDGAAAQDIAGAALAVSGVKLDFIGAARALREQAIPLLFRAQGTGLQDLALGQPVQVLVHSRSTVQGVRLPAAALVRSASNQTMVWIKAAPERFEPRVVTSTPLDGATVAVSAGLKPGERVVSEGALLINQIR